MDDSLLIIAAFALGIVFGLIIAFVLRITQAKSAQSLAEEILKESENRRKADEQVLLTTMQNNFGKLSSAVFKKSNETFLQLAQENLGKQTVQNAAELDSKKKLIDQQLNNMTTQLGKVTELVKEFENDRNKQYGALGEQLTALSQTSAQLQRALGDSRSRGQWGERMAEDILRLSGFIDGVNYRKQVISEGSRPDFTFFLPKNLMLNMDVKFPFDNYMKYLNAGSDLDRGKYCKDFLKDVRGHISVLTKREYINPAQSTVDFVLMFIPNEQIYRFIHEEDDGIINDALQQKVVLCSPLTLFIVLAIIRQAADNFALETSSREILEVLSSFKKQWGNFAIKMDEVEKHLKRTGELYSELVGKRRNDLEKPLKNIDELMTKHAVIETVDISKQIEDGILQDETNVLATTLTAPASGSESS
ncbi:MAG TPA: DNA recombination protein RmuC [Phototrophicaceae bacterium]|nr:DNA recombination protein RmuC [Phototrophicaceae bacterium]